VGRIYIALYFFSIIIGAICGNLLVPSHSIIIRLGAISIGIVAGEFIGVVLIALIALIAHLYIKYLKQK
jgi:hypothetical protein